MPSSFPIHYDDKSFSEPLPSIHLFHNFIKLLVFTFAQTCTYTWTSGMKYILRYIQHKAMYFVAIRNLYSTFLLRSQTLDYQTIPLDHQFGTYSSVHKTVLYPCFFPAFLYMLCCSYIEHIFSMTLNSSLKSQKPFSKSFTNTFHLSHNFYSMNESILCRIKTYRPII